MNLEVIRFSSGTDSTNGVLFETIEQGNDIDGSFKQRKFMFVKTLVKIFGRL